MIDNKRYYTEEEVMKKYNDMVTDKQNKVLTKALMVAVSGNTPTSEYAIAIAMGYFYEGKGDYTYVG